MPQILSGLVILLGLSGAAVAQSRTHAPARPHAQPPLRASITPPSRFYQQDGGQLYRAMCQGCHMGDGRGARGAGAYPSLAANSHLEVGSYPAMIVVSGLRAMPPTGNYLSDQQVAAVVNYIRTHFGNAYPTPVTAQEVRALRPTAR